MSVSTVGNGRVELSAQTVLVAVGDLLAIALFVAAGEFSHNINPLLNPGQFAGTLTPFYIGWLVVATVGGLYTAAATKTLQTSLGRAIVGWVLAVGIAQGIRATSLFPGDAALTFALVSVLVGGTLLVLWRAVVAVSLNR
ncbi:MAG: DUF3054 domain-containing protein [Haloarcula sp.]